MSKVAAKYAPLLVFAALVLVAASFGARYMPGPWYQALAKPAWTPPNWLFGPVWSVLYIMIAVAGWRVWRAGGIAPPLIVWAINILANGLWSYLMFGQQQIGLAFADITVVWLTIIRLYRVGLARRPDRRDAVRAVSDLGQLRLSPQLRHLAAQPLRPGRFQSADNRHA